MSATTLIQALQNPALYDFPISAFQVIETHLSWVILTGTYAYKIKKPVNLGFQDFTSLEKRQHYCQLEHSLNTRLVPELYVGVIPITGTLEHPTVGGKGTVIEWAIQMKEFAQSDLLSYKLTQNQLQLSHLTELAGRTAEFHQRSERAKTDSPWGDPATVYQPMQDNFEALSGLSLAHPYHAELATLADWTSAHFRGLSTLCVQRKGDGFIRACHGDMHLGNAILLNDKPRFFDCIEFNESFRWIDTINDIAFLMMDLEKEGHPYWANAFLNMYLECTSDVEGLRLLRLYKAYRAMVRAKVTAFQAQDNKQSLDQLDGALRAYIQLALSYTIQVRPTLSITMGVSASGKTTYTQHLIEHHASLIRLRSDVVRKQHFQLDPNQPCPDDRRSALYQPETRRLIYKKLCEQAKTLLKAGFSVVIDAAFLTKAQRADCLALAKACDVPFQIYPLAADEETLAQRLNARPTGASDADLSVLKQQLAEQEPLSEAERAYQVPL